MRIRSTGPVLFGIAALSLVVIALLFVISGGLDLFGSHAKGHFPNALVDAAPSPWRGDKFVGYAALNEAALRTVHRKVDGKKVRYVGAGTASDGPLTVSVLPLGKYELAAVALGSNGRCYSIILESDHANPKLGAFHFGLVKNGPCRASAVSRVATRLTEPPE